MNRTEIKDAKACPTGSGTEKAYSVEARYAYHEPREVAGSLLDNRWRRVHFRKGAIGVPASSRAASILAGLHTFEEAMALRYWFICEADQSGMGNFCLETRLVEHQVKYSYEATPVFYVDAHDRLGNAPKEDAALKGDDRD